MTSSRAPSCAGRCGARSTRPDGLRHDDVAPSVAAALNLDFAGYAAAPGARFGAREDAESALRNVVE